MAVVRVEALRALGRLLESKVPAIEGKVRVQHATPSKIQVYPTVTLQPAGKWRHVGYGGAHVLRSLPAGHTVFDCGHKEGLVQMVIAATSWAEREELAQAVERVFLGNELRPGVVVVPVTACTDLGDITATFMLDDDESDDAQAFDNVFESITALRCNVPALAIDEVPTIQELQLGLTEDFKTQYTGATMMTSSQVEVVLINEDGSISPAP